MSKFRKKPVVIDAMRWTGHNQFDLMRWASELQAEARWYFNGPSIHIETLEGVMTASPGDWIIQGGKGEFYPCKPDTFEATYEPNKETGHGDDA